MRIAIISDIHYGQTRKSSTHPGLIRLPSSEALNKLQETIPLINLKQPLLLFQLGDVVKELNDLSQDRHHFDSVVKSLGYIRAPVINLIGNHDISAFSIDQLQNIYRSNNFQFDLIGSLDVGRYRFIWIDLSSSKEKGIYLCDKTYSFLEKALQSEKKIILFSHAPLASIDNIGSFYWSFNLDNFSYINGNRIIQMIKNKKILACINGHNHWLAYQKVEGIHFLTIPSFSENIAGMDFPTNLPGVYSTLDINPEKLILKCWSGNYCFSTLELEA